jgi:protein kinase A
MDKKVQVPYTPTVKSAGDTSNFTEYPESDENTPAIKESDDPFLNW